MKPFTDLLDEIAPKLFKTRVCQVKSKPYDYAIFSHNGTCQNEALFEVDDNYWMCRKHMNEFRREQ